MNEVEIGSSSVENGLYIEKKRKRWKRVKGEDWSYLLECRGNVFVDLR